MPEDELVLLAQQGDGEAFVELTDRTRAACLRTACSIVKDAADAEDQLQTAYLNAWKQIHHFRSEARFSTWMSRIVTNQCLMALRSRRKAPVVSATFDPETDLTPEFRDPTPGVEESFTQEQERALIRQELKCVPPFLRKAIEMVYFSETPIPEAAEQLGVSVPAFKSRLSRARTFLKQRLEKHYQVA